MISDKTIIQMDLSTHNQQQKLYYCIIQSHSLIEISLQLIQFVYSIVYKHLEYIGIISFCILYGISIILLMSQKKIKKIFMDQDQDIQLSNQGVCKICKRYAILFKCQICMICNGCDQKNHSQCQRIDLDKIQLQKLLQIILGIKLRTVISIFSQIYALQKYYSDKNELFYIFFTSLILGTVINMILFFVLMKMIKRIKQIKSIQDQIDIQKGQYDLTKQQQIQSDFLAQNLNEIKGKLTSSSFRIREPSISISNSNLQRFQILNFIEKKIGQKQTFDKIAKVFETDPTLIMFDENQNDENQIDLKMQRLSIFVPQSKNDLS